ncbi:sensor of ECF-type sigma factor [Gelatiniphilus marinus]|uniref:Sensor of ECF-type sigma factor n=1 Tax=Gelatiniphilus marinus TaxID=1759464 RepID=A0ABW5JUP6_9FLAO
MKKIITTLLLLTLSLTAFSQGKERKERIRALKTAHITEKLDLSEKEAQKFWPIYNAYNENMKTLKHVKVRKIRQEIKQNINTLTNQKAQEFLNQLSEAENSMHNERLKLVNDLKGVISPKKILLLKIAEEEFNRKLFEQIRSRHQGGKKRN